MRLFLCVLSFTVLLSVVGVSCSGPPAALPEMNASASASENSPPVRNVAADASEQVVVARSAQEKVAAKPLVRAVEKKTPVRKAKVDPPPHTPNASDAFFNNGVIPNIHVKVSEPELNKLKGDNRNYVRCSVEIDGKMYNGVGVKLKGAAGSFRGWDDRPALTLNMEKYEKGQTFHDMQKFHLNNSVQDDTYLSELICGELFRKAGVPATRATHARVKLNGRDVGFYVLKEGFDKPFLKRFFEKANGNLYDGGFLRDIDQELEKDSGDGVDDNSDLHALRDACREGDPTKRNAKLEAVLDIDAMISFIAMELMTCHWDGYCQNRNNYRIYFNPTNNKAYFFPHGMDQMFGDPNFGILNNPGGMAGNMLMQNKRWRAKYRKRLNELLPLFTSLDALNKRVDEVAARIQTSLATINPQLAKDHAGRVQGYKDRLKNRAQSLMQQVATQEALPLEFDGNGEAMVNAFQPQKESGDAILEKGETAGVKGYLIRTGPSNQCVASWRQKVLLGRGKYVFRANVLTKDVQSTPHEKGQGAGVRLGGVNRPNKVEGTSNWTKVEYEFEVTDEWREVDLVAELRATKGEAWFEENSLRIAVKK